MHEARAEVTGRVDGVAGGAAEAVADGEDEQADDERGQWARRDGLQGDDPEHQHERGHCLGHDVHGDVADLRNGGEDAELAAGGLLQVQVLLVDDPDDQGAQHRTQQLPRDVGHHLGETQADAQFRSGGQQAEGHCRVQVGTGLPGHVDGERDRQTPPPVDEQPAAAQDVALGLGQDGVGDDAAAHHDEDKRSNDFRNENVGEHDHSLSRVSDVRLVPFP